MDDHRNPLSVEVIYLTPTTETCIALNLPENTPVLEGITRSSILEKHPEIDLQKNKVGIFGKIVSLDTILKHGDRVEIYRPLMLDPKQRRLLKAKK